MLGSLIGAAGSLLGGFMNRSAQENENETARLNQDYWNQQSYDLTRDQWREAQDRTIQNRVADARSAGIHPLYALGQPAASAAQFIPGQAPTGSVADTGIGEAFRAIGGGLDQRQSQRIQREQLSTQRRVANAQVRSLEARAARDEATAAVELSALRRASAASNVIQDKVKTLPVAAGLPLSERPLESTPRQSMPAEVEVVGPKGRRTIPNPELGLDEVSQADWIARPWLEYFQSLLGNSQMTPQTPEAAKYWWPHYLKRGK